VGVGVGSGVGVRLGLGVAVGVAGGGVSVALCPQDTSNMSVAATTATAASREHGSTLLCFLGVPLRFRPNRSSPAIQPASARRRLPPHHSPLPFHLGGLRVVFARKRAPVKPAFELWPAALPWNSDRVRSGAIRGLLAVAFALHLDYLRLRLLCFGQRESQYAVLEYRLGLVCLDRYVERQRT
jgi:hypothetical protein